nr:hypothetical protein [Tanacetum cinerariifolium]
MHQEEHVGFDDEYDFLTNMILYKKLSLVSDAENVSTKASAATSDQIAMIAILNNLTSQVRQEQGLAIQRNQRNAELLKENELLKSTLLAKDKSIKFLKSKKEKVLTDKKELVDSYLDDIDILGTRNSGLGYLAKHTQPVLYDGNTLLDPTLTPVSVWDSDNVLVHQVVSMHKMKDKPGHVRPESGFYTKLNAIKFVPQIELSREQAYWLNSQDHTPSKPITPFVRKERTTKKPLYISVACFDYAKEFAKQQLTPFYEHFKKHINTVDATIRKEVAEYKQIFDDLDAEYECCVLENKNLKIEKKNLLIKNDCLIAECLEKDICSIVLSSNLVVPPSLDSLDCMLAELRTNCNREHSKVLELEAEVLKRQHMLTESEKRKALETKLTQLKDTITALRIQNDGFKVTNATQKTKIAKLKAKDVGNKSNGTTTPTNPKVLALGMYAKGPKYIIPHKRTNKESPIPMSRKKHVTFKEPPKPSPRVTKKPVAPQVKKADVAVHLSTGIKSATGASKTASKNHAWIYK